MKKEANAKKKNGFKVFTAILSLLIAVVMWFFVMTVQDPDTQRTFYSLPVTYVGAEGFGPDKSFVIRAGSVPLADVVVRGSMNDLAKLDEMRDQIKVTCAIGNVTEGGAYVRDVNVVLPATLDKDVFVVRKTPGTVTLNMEKVESEHVPIVVKLDVIKDADFDLGIPVCDPETLTVMGPASLLKTIKEARVTVEKDNADTTFTSAEKFVLVDHNDKEIVSKDLLCETTTVQVQVPVYKTKSVPLKLNLVEGAGLKTNNVEVKIEPESLRVKGDPVKLDELNVIVLDPAFDLAEMAGNTMTITRDVTVANGLTNMSEVTQAEITMTLKGVTSRAVGTTNIEIVNVPKEYTVEPVGKSLEVKLRGPTDSVNQIKPEDIQVTVDMSKQDDRLAVGLFNAKVTVTIKGYNSVALLEPDKYKLSVDIKTAEATTG